MGGGSAREPIRPRGRLPVPAAPTGTGATGPAPRRCDMLNDSPRWEPGRNAIHRLIQLLDVSAIAFNRFRQRSFHLPSHNPPQPFDTDGWQTGLARLSHEFNAVRGAIFSGYVAPGHRAARLVDEAIAAFARAGARDEATVAAVTNAAQWLAVVGTPWEVGEPPRGIITSLCRAPGNDLNRKVRCSASTRRFGEVYSPRWRASARRCRRKSTAAPPWRTTPGRKGQPIPSHKTDCLALFGQQNRMPRLRRPARPKVTVFYATTGRSRRTHRLTSPHRTRPPNPLPPASPNNGIVVTRLFLWRSCARVGPNRPSRRSLPRCGSFQLRLSESRFGGPSAHLGLTMCEHWLEFPAWLAFAQERGLGRTAAEWAVYRLIEAGRLCVVWPEVDRLAPITHERATERAERYRGRAETVTDWDLFECGRILQIRSTPAACGNGSDVGAQATLRQAHRQPRCGQGEERRNRLLPRTINQAHRPPGRSQGKARRHQPYNRRAGPTRKGKAEAWGIRPSRCARPRICCKRLGKAAARFATTRLRVAAFQKAARF